MKGKGYIVAIILAVAAMLGAEPAPNQTESNASNPPVQEVESVILSETTEKVVSNQEVEKQEEEIQELKEQIKQLEAENAKLETKVETLEKSKITSTQTATSANRVLQSNSTQTEQTVYITKTGSKYHRSGCSYLKSSIPISKSEAIGLGYGACSRCKP